MTLALVVALGPTGEMTARAEVHPGMNGFITFVHGTELRGLHVHRASPDGSLNRIMTFDGQSHSPAWSPDGRRIVYVTAGRLRLMRADRSAKQFLNLHGSSPTWSPDGRHIAYLSNGALRLTTPKGVTSRRLTGTRAERAIFSPVSNDEIMLDDAIYTISTGALKPIPIRHVAPSDTVESLDWMPDGSHVVFISRCNSAGRCGEQDLYTASVTGGPRAAVTQRSPCGSDCEYLLLGVSPAPDGRDFLISGYEFYDDFIVNCVYALVARFTYCANASLSEDVYLGDWQSIR